MKKLLLVALLVMIPFTLTLRAEEGGDILVVSWSHVDGEEAFSIGMATEIATVFSMDVKVLVHGDWTSDGHLGGAFLFTRDIGKFTSGIMLGASIDAQLILPEDATLFETAEFYGSHGTYNIGIFAGLDISDQVGLPIMLSGLWYESVAFQEGTLYRSNSQFYANLSIGIGKIPFL